MPTVQKILAPIDFSEPSGQALKYASDLAALMGAKLVVLHVYDVPTFTFPEGSYIPTADEAARIASAAQKALDQAMDALPPVDGAAKPEAILRKGAPAEEVLRAADELSADLIVMGTHGRGFFSRALMGSIAQDVIRRSTKPVLTLRGEGDG